jgi:hypothetical protein
VVFINEHVLRAVGKKEIHAFEITKVEVSRFNSANDLK